MMKSKNILSEKKIPAINQRVKMIIDHYAGGSVKLFSEKIELANSQKLNRIFNVDQRNGEYPIVSSDILIAIANMFSEVDINWILTGKEEMLRNTSLANNSNLDSSIYMIDKIEKQSKEIGRLEKEVEVLRDIIEKQAPDASDSKEEGVPTAGNAIAV